MPHVVFTGHAELEPIWESFEPAVHREGDWLTKLTSCFLDSWKRVVLVEATVVCRGVTHNFYVRVDSKPEQVTVRVEPRTNVEKNLGVKLAVAMVAKLLRSASPQLSIEKTNLPQEALVLLEACS